MNQNIDRNRTRRSSPYRNKEGRSKNQVSRREDKRPESSHLHKDNHNSGKRFQQDVRRSLARYAPKTYRGPCGLGRGKAGIKRPSPQNHKKDNRYKEIQKQPTPLKQLTPPEVEIDLQSEEDDYEQQDEIKEPSTIMDTGEMVNKQRLVVRESTVEEETVTGVTKREVMVNTAINLRGAWNSVSMAKTARKFIPEKSLQELTAEFREMGRNYRDAANYFQIKVATLLAEGVEVSKAYEKAFREVRNF